MVTKSNNTNRIDEIRSEEVQEILTNVPHWMIRQGSIIFLVLILMFLILSYIIKYPDIIKGTIELTTDNPPIELVSKTNGVIKKIYKNNSANALKGDCIVLIENPIPEASIYFIKQLVNNFDLQNLNNYTSLDTINYKFGSIQQEFNQLVSSIKEYIFLDRSNINQNKRDHLIEQLNQYSRLTIVNERQQLLTNQDINNSIIKLKSIKILYDSEVVSKLEYFKQQGNVNSKKRGLERLKEQNIQNKITITSLKKQLDELKYQIKNDNRVLLQKIQSNIKNLKTFVHTWKQNYQLISPIDGNVNYSSQLAIGQFITSGITVSTIVPRDNKILGIIKLSANGMGKVKVGQSVIINLDHYPSFEYGELEGVVTNISSIADVDQKNQVAFYHIEVSIDNQLITNHNKEISFIPQMPGNARIITEDLRLIQRFFNQFRNIFKRD